MSENIFLKFEAEQNLQHCEILLQHISQNQSIILQLLNGWRVDKISHEELARLFKCPVEKIQKQERAAIKKLHNLHKLVTKILNKIQQTTISEIKNPNEQQ